ncbi:hypothetical protein Tco_1199945 [Tanacetum coccineum]
MTITRSGITPKAIEELISQRMAEALDAHEANHGLGPIVESESENRDDDENGNSGGNKNGNSRGNGNGNSGGNRNGNGEGNGNHGDNNGNGNRNEMNKGVGGFGPVTVKMEYVYRINDCPVDSQVKFATCTLLDGSLTWWNSYVKTIGINEAYGMSWKELKKLMIEV